MNLFTISAGQIASSVWASQAIGQINIDGGSYLTVVSAAGAGVYGAYVQVVASTSHDVRGVIVGVVGVADTDLKLLALAVGGAGSEVNKVLIPVIGQTQAMIYSWIPLDVSLFPKGVRMSVALANQSGATQRTVTAVVIAGEANN